LFKQLWDKQSLCHNNSLQLLILSRFGPSCQNEEDVHHWLPFEDFFLVKVVAGGGTQSTITYF
jgi:hypothetical protein